MRSRIIQWHPTRPVIASVTVSGDIHIWQTTSPDNWAAFAPGFEELEENVEYDEREDEFDIVRPPFSFIHDAHVVSTPCLGFSS